MSLSCTDFLNDLPRILTEIADEIASAFALTGSFDGSQIEAQRLHVAVSDVVARLHELALQAGGTVLAGA